MTDASNAYRFPREAPRMGVIGADGDTPAFNAFWATSTQIDALLATVFGVESDQAHTLLVDSMVRESDALRVRNDSINSEFSGPWLINIERQMLNWQVVMRVTAFEVYLRDVLTHFALYNPELLRRRSVKLEWSFDEVWRYSENDSVLYAFCDNWAKNFVDKGGPQVWFKKLTRMGVPDLNDSEERELESMWGMRHMIVHNSGRLTYEFGSRHPDLADIVYDGAFSIEHLLKWDELLQAVVRSIDSFIVGTLKRILGADLIAESQKLQFEDMMRLMHQRFAPILEEMNRRDAIEGDDHGKGAA